jgi:hypothetical protein
MKTGMAALVLGLLIVLSNHPAAAQDHWYWALEQGNTRTYLNTDNPQDKVFQQSDGEAYDATIWRSRHEVGETVITESALLLNLDAEGNVWLHGWYEPLILPDKPFIMIEAPLEVGASWDQLVAWSSGSMLHHVEEVLEAGEVEIPFSRAVYYCYRVKLSIYHEGQLIATADRWINDGVGIVKYKVTEYFDPPTFLGWGQGEYVLVDGVVPTEDTTWGAVKAMYR